MKLTTFTKKMMKTSTWLHIGVALLVLYVIYRVYSYMNPPVEGFAQREKYVLKQGDEVYDDFYVDFYDELLFDPVKNNYELNEFQRAGKLDKKKSYILDVGSGTGRHVHSLHKNNYKCTGVDKSSAMVSYAKNKFKGIDVRQGDVMSAMLFPKDSFTHVTCFYFTIYNMEDKTTFFRNCYNWLKPGGYLMLHLVDKDKFNPIISSADPLMIVNPQKYSKKRITNSIVKFKDFTYKADFKVKNDTIAEFDEVFKDNTTKNVRQNKHVLYMENKDDILRKAKQSGFITKGKIDMVNCQYEYQYIYVLYKRF
jgi:ubiquinone/menaquinone biosynthesis C-methylase UbiE